MWNSNARPNPPCPLCLTHTGDVKVLSGEGMPHYKRPFDKGDLFVTFEIEFPAPGWIAAGKLPALEALLPEKMKLDIHGDHVQEVDMIDFDPNTHGGNRSNGQRCTLRIL